VPVGKLSTLLSPPEVALKLFTSQVCTFAGTDAAADRLAAAPALKPICPQLKPLKLMQLKKASSLELLRSKKFCVPFPSTSQATVPSESGGRRLPSVTLLASTNEKPGMPCAAATPGVGV
jgi:hypothetical protein